MKMLRASLLCKDSRSVHFLPLSSIRVHGPTVILWDRLEQQCLAGPHGKEGEVLPKPSVWSIYSTPSSLSAANAIRSNLRMHTGVAGDPQGSAREGGHPVVYIGVILWLLRQSQIPSPLPPHDEYAWNVKAGR